MVGFERGYPDGLGVLRIGDESNFILNRNYCRFGFGAMEQLKPKALFEHADYAGPVHAPTAFVCAASPMGP